MLLVVLVVLSHAVVVADVTVAVALVVVSLLWLLMFLLLLLLRVLHDRDWDCGFPGEDRAVLDAGLAVEGVDDVGSHAQVKLLDLLGVCDPLALSQKFFLGLTYWRIVRALIKRFVRN